MSALLLRLVISLAVAGYAVVALVHERWWLSGAVAAVAAVLLWRRHPRARFTTYILLSALAMRGLFGHAPRALVFAVVLVGLMQLPAATRTWPRLVLGARPGRDRDRMAAP